MQITIKQSTIKAVAHAMAKNDIRYYLNGMLVHTNGHDTRLVAIDGHRMNIAIIERTMLIEAPKKYIIPASLVSTICTCKAPRDNKKPEVTLTFHDGKVAAELPDGTEAVAKLVDGIYPDYDRVIPKTLSGEVAQYNPEYVLDAYKSIADYLGVKDHNFGLSMNGQNGCAAMACDGFAALIMPWRAKTVTTIDSRLLSPIASPEPVSVEA
jgi:DNA polymerase-3 subunit beta